MIAVAGYGAVSEWFHPVVVRPIAPVGPAGRARVAALSVDLAEHCFALTGGACDVGRICRAASALARTALAATEVVGDLRDGAGGRLVIQSVGTRQAVRAALSLVVRGPLTVDGEEFEVVRDAVWRAPTPPPPGTVLGESVFRAMREATWAEGPSRTSHSIALEARPAGDDGSPVGSACRYVQATVVDPEDGVAQGVTCAARRYIHLAARSVLL
eukprot:2016640-Alexandrium_andersonii.AAC.1